ncbi:MULTISPECIES: hypothetical protein [unclassified Enterococcus]|uniref:hypothetical protein n=1 Tax=unclassified Enterococcus TaxID=2608891 RepID=UPI001A9B1255|nr:hypothetical protein [Enterococcus sp. DIV1271a]MBO1298708.1 hypothetical protein [Enterococcus sp. DIV1271a]
MEIEETLKDNSKNEFNQKLEILTLALSLKESNQRVASPEFYKALYSTYIKMFENDKDQFFIAKEKQGKVIESLKRSMAFYNTNDSTFLQKAFDKMTNNDPTDFMLIPNLNRLDQQGEMSPYYCGLLLYKKENDLFVVYVDRKDQFEIGQVSYARIPETKIADLSKLISHEWNVLNPGAFSLFKDIELMSTGFKGIPPLNMPMQGIDGKISAVEDALKVALFHCGSDMFSLDTNEKIIPLWNNKVTDAFIEMRKRFLEAVKSENKVWNEPFDYIFDFYLYRTGKSKINEFLPDLSNREWWDRTIQHAFANDPYIHVLESSNGQINAMDEEQLQKTVEWAVKPMEVLYGKKLKQVDSHELKDSLYLDGILITMYEDRLAMIKNPQVKEMNQRSLLRLEERYQEVNREIKQRVFRERKKINLGSNSHWLMKRVSNIAPTSINKLFKKESINQSEIYDLKKRLDMLALVLSLKPNNNGHFFPGMYKLLIPTYIKMLENDQDSFFIDKKRKSNIVQSLKRTTEVYELKKVKYLQNMFEKLRNNDPTDFVLLPTRFQLLDPKKSGHAIGLVVYKRDNEFVVLQVDKEQFFGRGAVSYVKVLERKIKDLSQILLSKKNYYDLKPYGILKNIEAISHNFKAIPSIKLARQTTGNCTIIEIESTLKMILFNCKQDIFRLDPSEIVTPKWNMRMQEIAALEMKKRFLAAMKGPNQDWNKNLDHVFAYYLLRKQKSRHWGEAEALINKNPWYTNIRHLFRNDFYILEIWNNGGKIPAEFDQRLKEKINKLIGPTGILLNREISTVELFELYRVLAANTLEVELLQARHPYLKIPIAIAIGDYYMACIKAKNVEIESEIRRRINLEQKRSSQQLHNQSLAKENIQKPAREGAKSHFSLACERVKRLAASERQDAENNVRLNKKDCLVK